MGHSVQNCKIDLSNHKEAVLRGCTLLLDGTDWILTPPQLTDGLSIDMKEQKLPNRFVELKHSAVWDCGKRLGLSAGMVSLESLSRSRHFPRGLPCQPQIHF
jgi:hypothetical protein